MWALITGGVIFGMTILFSLGKASSKREEAAHSHRKELLARSKNCEIDPEITTRSSIESSEQRPPYKENKTRHPSEQI